MAATQSEQTMTGERFIRDEVSRPSEPPAQRATIAQDVLVSIVVPTYNRAWGLKPALASAFVQTYAAIEVIVMDDASSDETPEVIRHICDERLRPYRQPKNVGMVANWGAGLEQAQGQFVVFLSDDDLLGSDFVANRIRYMAEDPSTTVVFSRYDVQDRVGNHINTSNAGFDTPQWLDTSALLEAALARRWFIGAAMYRRSAIAALWPHIANDNLVLDFGLNIRLALCGKGHGVYTPVNDFIMRVHEGQNSQAKREQVMRETDEALARLLRQPLPPPLARRLGRELANWNVVWGRMLAAEGRLEEARARFWRGAHCSPRLLWAWKQLLLSWVAPQRFIV